MKSLTPSSSCWAAMTKTGMVLTFVLSLMPVHAIEEVKVGLTDNADPVIVTNDRVKLPHKHRRVVPAPVKPLTSPVKPQQPVLWLR